MKPRTPIFLFALMPLLAGCSRAPDTFAPPEQRRPLYVPANTNGLGHFVSMRDPNAAVYLVTGFAPSSEGEGWRWTYRRPEMRFYLPKTDGLKFVMDFAIPERIFRQMGAPVTLSFFVNNRPFEQMRLEQGGEQHFRHDVPADLLIAGAPNTVAIQSDKYWTAPADGAVLGFILSRAGFTE